MAKGTIIRPDKGKNKTGNKIGKNSLRKKIKKCSKQISDLYPSVKVNEREGRVNSVEWLHDYTDPERFESNGGKHPYKGLDLVENYIANLALSGSLYKQDAYELLDMLRNSKTMHEFVKRMSERGFYILEFEPERTSITLETKKTHEKFMNLRFTPVSQTRFWDHTKDKLVARPTLAEYIIQIAEGIPRTEANLAEVEALLREHDRNAALKSPLAASTILEERLKLLALRNGTPEDQKQAVEESTLTLDEANERMKKLELSSSADEHRNKIERANSDRRPSYEGDPLLQRKWDAVREDAGSMNAPACLFSILSAQQENFMIQRHPAFPAGHKDDWTWYKDYQNFYVYSHADKENVSVGMLNVIMENDDGTFGNAFDLKQEQEANERQRAHFQYFKESLRCPGMFAVPAWWYSETQHCYSLAVAQYLTQDWDEPFPTGSYASVVSRAADWHDRQNSVNPGRFKEYLRSHNDYVKSVVVAQEYPEMVPFKTTFINLEDGSDESVAGHLIYNRYLGQVGQIRHHMAPTTAFGPDGRAVPLDAIFQSGFYFHENDEGGPLGRKVIYGLYHGYVISREHCPEGVPFIRIPMICPIHVDGRWYPNQPEFENHFSHQSPIIPVIDMMIDGLNEHKTVVRNFTKAERKRSVKVGRESGVGKVTPRRYTRVQMSAGTTQIPPMEDCPLMRLPKWKLTKRIKCRKHERCYIQHGRLPLETEHKELLLSRGYTIYKDNLDIGPRDAKRLNLRNIPWPDGFRWVAIRTIIIDEHEKGPEGTEVVPLVLVPDSDVMKQSTQFELDSIGRPTK